MSEPFTITDDTLLRDVVVVYIETNPRMGSVQSGRRYFTTSNNYDRFLGRPATVADLTETNYGKWINYRRKEGRLAGGTIRGEAEKLLVVWRWIAKRTGRPQPDVLLPQSSISQPRTWNEAELAQLERSARKCNWWIGGVPACIFWPAIIGVAVDTGERMGAIHALRPDDIDLHNRVVTFRRETRKGGRCDSRKTLSKRTCQDVDALVKHSPENPFAPVKQASLYGPMRRLLVEAGLSAERNNMFHNFRRYHATQVAKAGGDVSLALGHSDPRLARKSYVDAMQMPQFLPKRRPGGFFSGLKRRLGFTG